MHTSFKRNVETRNHAVQFEFIMENIHFVLLVLCLEQGKINLKFDNFSKCGKSSFLE